MRWVYIGRDYFLVLTYLLRKPEVIKSTDLFPSDMLHDMLQKHFSDAGKDELWITIHDSGMPVGVAYAAPEAMTEGLPKP